MSVDQANLFIEQVKSAAAENKRLVIQGHASKSNWLPAVHSDSVLALREHTGVLQYEPEELVITARGGTPLAEINAVLAERQQMLACEPPLLAQASDLTPRSTPGGTVDGTLGGAVACGLSGPGRPWLGAIRDAVLGVELINGDGEYLKFGGQVMKNVAGYDVSRLQAGAWGALGVMSVVSLRVQPSFAAEQTLSREASADDALRLCAEIGTRNLPITGSAWYDGTLYLRLAGNDSGVAAACESLADHGLGRNVTSNGLWQRLKDHQHSFFEQADAQAAKGRKLWRVITPPAAPMPQFLTAAEDALVLWGGGLRWIYHDDAAAVAAYCASVDGWYWAIGEGMPMEPMQRQIMTHLVEAFDPHGVFANPLGLGAGGD